MSIAYQVAGIGSRAVVAVHGWFGDEATFEQLLPALDTDRYTWLLVALRGYGISRHLTGEMTIDEAASDCLELAARMGFERFSIVGHSMGGKAALRVLSLAPDRVEALVGVAPVPASAVPFPPPARQLFESAATDPGARREILDHSTGRRLARAWLDAKVAHSLRSAAPEAIAGYFSSWADGDFSAALAGAAVPALVVVGEHDADITEEVMRHTYRAWLPDLELVVFPNCGHYPPEEAPIALASALGAFLDRSSTQP